MKGAILAALLPLLVLLALAILACLLSTGLLLTAGPLLPLPKLISKVTLLLLLLSVFPLKRWLGLSFTDLGFAKAAFFFRQLAVGLLLSLVSLLPVLLMLYGLGVQEWDDGRNWTMASLTEKLAISLLLALLIAVGEELLFRGLLLSSLRRHLPLGIAIALSAAYYAALHFLQSAAPIGADTLAWHSGFPLLVQAFGNWLNPNIATAFVGLWVVGLFLATLRSRIAVSLRLCIGCHTGWVWQIKSCKELLNLNPHSDWLWLVSSYDGVVGPLVSVWLGLAVVAMLRVQLPRPASQ